MRLKLRKVWDAVSTLLAPVKHFVETRKTSEHHRDHTARIFLHDYEGRRQILKYLHASGTQFELFMLAVKV